MATKIRKFPSMRAIFIFVKIYEKDNTSTNPDIILLLRGLKTKQKINPRVKRGFR
jgi:hypothetical protein